MNIIKFMFGIMIHRNFAKATIFKNHGDSS